MSDETKTLSLSITGKVQGVGFRAFTRDLAHANAISGWVRNEADGTVSSVISGSQSSVEAMLTALHQGPPFARVDRIETQSADPPPLGFSIRR